jgi:5-methylcytosine-specific restriction endonuclease McrA
MVQKVVTTLWGDVEVVETAPKCELRDCVRPADNAGNGKYHKLCSTHHKEKYGMKGGEYKRYRKLYCENVDGRLGYYCTASIVDPRHQLSVDHIDGDPSNNDSDNLQTLCFNCHHLKTRMFNDRETPGRKTLGL